MCLAVFCYQPGVKNRAFCYIFVSCTGLKELLDVLFKTEGAAVHLVHLSVLAKDSDWRHQAESWAAVNKEVAPVKHYIGVQFPHGRGFKAQDPGMNLVSGWLAQQDGLRESAH